MSNPKQDSTVAILTALPEELDAVLGHAGDWTKIPAGEGKIRTYYATRKGGRKVVTASALSMGQLNAALLARDVLLEHAPDYFLLAGIAGGLGDARLGDVVVSDQIVDYELQKVRDSGPDVRWSVYRSDPGLLDAALNFRSDDWKSKIGTPRPDGQDKSRTQLHVGVVLSGNKVIASANAAGALRSVWTKSAALEMEATGVAAALYQSAERPGFMMVKGVCDRADSRKDDQWHEFASHAAAAYCWAILDVLPSHRPKVGPSRPELSIEADVGSIDWRGLRFALSEAYNLDELEVLAFDLGVDWDEIPGRNKSGKIVGLVKYLKRRRKLPELVVAVNQDRDGLLASYEADFRGPS
ncbi:MAG: hypothetical protein MJE77_15095 [Proteobacteria bacterium]|nr:hypothetical protein [Pseudomonadota bacterium]